MGCCQMFARIVMIFSNFIALLVGLSMTVVAGWMMTDITSLLEAIMPGFILHFSTLNLINDAGFTLMVGSLFAIIMSTFAIAGAWRKIRIILVLYMSAMVVTFMALSVSGAVSLARPDLVELFVEKTLETESDLGIQNGLLDFAHNAYECCGIANATFCEKNYPPYDVCFENSTACEYGCLEPVMNHLILPFTDVAGITLMFFATVTLCGVLFTCCLYCSLDSKSI